MDTNNIKAYHIPCRRLIVMYEIECTECGKNGDYTLMEHQSGKIVFICEECDEGLAEMRGEGIENGFELDESYLKHRNTLGFVFEPVVEEKHDDLEEGLEYTGQVRILKVGGHIDESYNGFQIPVWKDLDEQENIAEVKKWCSKEGYTYHEHEDGKVKDYYKGCLMNTKSYALMQPIKIVCEPNPKYDKIEHGVSCRKRQHGHGLDCGETRKKRYEKLNAQAIANGFAGVCRESATYEGKCRCGGKIWSDDEEICIPPLGEQKPMHMDCASEYMDVIKRESEAEMYYQDDGWD